MHKQGEEIVNTLLELLKQLRLQKGYTIEDLADRANLHRTTVGLLERKERTPSVQVAIQLAEALETNLSDLLIEAETNITSKSISDSASHLINRITDDKNFFNEERYAEITGLSLQHLKISFDSCYETLDTIDHQLVSRGLLPIGQLVELANLSSMLGNLLGAGMAEISNGAFVRNKPHAYPDLLSQKANIPNLEIKIALESNKPKGHLAKDGFYIVLRYVLGDKNGSFKIGKENRGDTIWLWEARIGELTLDDFALSNTPGDSGKTAVVKTEPYYRMTTVYFDPNYCPYPMNKGKKYPGCNV